MIQCTDPDIRSQCSLLCRLLVEVLGLLDGAQLMTGHQGFVRCPERGKRSMARGTG